MPLYEIIVGNVGTVYSGKDKQESDNNFTAYVHMSKRAGYRASNEDVTMLIDGEIEKEYLANMDE